MAILTFYKDYSNSIELDSLLMGVPDSDAFWNTGTSPIVTIKNILTYLPVEDIVADAYAAGTTYAIGDICTSNAIMYESILGSNIGNTPASSPTYWVVTNSDSQKIKVFLNQVKTNAKTALKLDRKLIENQYIYHIAKSDVTPNADYIGWGFEHKNSDYVSIRINKLAFQANTDQEITFSLVNNGAVVNTIAITPDNGRFVFSDVNLTMSGFGVFYLVTDAISIKTNGEVNDPLKYRGLVCYPVEAVGGTIATADYQKSMSGNGMGFNVSAYVDTSSFIVANEIDFVEVYKWQLAYDLVQLMLFNPQTNSSREERNMTEFNRDLMIMEAKDNKLNTITTNYNKALKQAKEAIAKSLDNVLKFQDTDIKVKHSTL